MPADMMNIVDLILEDRMDEAEYEILHESENEKMLRHISENSYMNILLKFESYLNNHDVYLYGKEWDEAEILMDKIKVDKFWVTIYMVASKKIDLRGALRLKNENESQNKVQYKKLDDGDILLKFKILKRYLDQIEQDDKEKAKEIAKDEG